MTWFRVDTGLYGHRKTRKLARLLKVRQGEAAGLVVGFLSYVTDNAEDGNVTDLDWDDAKAWLGWRGADLRQALVESEFIDVEPDGSAHAHDYDDWNGKLVERRQKDRERKASVRRTKCGTSAGQSAPVRNLSDPTTRHDTERNGTVEEGSVGAPVFPSSAWTPEQRAAAKGWRKASSDPRAFDAIVKQAAEERLVGGGFGWPVVGQALLEMRGTSGASFNLPYLLGCCRKIRDRVPEKEPTTMVSDDLSRMVECRAVDGWWVAVEDGRTIAEVRP